jgi:hypothetical protein
VLTVFSQRHTGANEIFTFSLLRVKLLQPEGNMKNGGEGLAQKSNAENHSLLKPSLFHNDIFAGIKQPSLTVSTTGHICRVCDLFSLPSNVF